MFGLLFPFKRGPKPRLFATFTQFEPSGTPKPETAIGTGTKVLAASAGTLTAQYLLSERSEPYKEEPLYMIDSTIKKSGNRWIALKPVSKKPSLKDIALKFNDYSVDLEKTVGQSTVTSGQSTIRTEKSELKEFIDFDLVSKLEGDRAYLLAIHLSKYPELSEERALEMAGLFELAAHVGHVESAFNAGLCYDPLNKESPVPSDRNKAIVYYKQAAHEGHSRAQYRLGMLLLNGQVSLEVYKEAVGWVSKAALGNNKAAQDTLKLLRSFDCL
ncbi:hypothetical protein HDV04_003054 [Boothiomyces sp. JEL0838]|nr:hypothetical protein HDV04_003054 [Boothiomyces sp. JEL0838]